MKKAGHNTVLIVWSYFTIQTKHHTHVHTLEHTEIEQGLEGHTPKTNGGYLLVCRVLSMFYFISFDMYVVFVAGRKYCFLVVTSHSHITHFNSLHSLSTLYIFLIYDLLVYCLLFLNLSLLFTLISSAPRICFSRTGTQ